MLGISSKGKEAIGRVVDEMFDTIALRFLGHTPRTSRAKSLEITSSNSVTLPHLFIQGMGNKTPNEVEKDVLKSILESAHGYIEGAKNRAKSNITERVDGLAREARLKKIKLDEKDVQFVLDEEMKRSRAQVEAIIESEATKFRNLGNMMDISRVASNIGDNDPTVFFVVVRDGVTCKECLKLHLTASGDPRLWKFSELKQGYHKRGEENPSAFGLHPHCFTEDTLIHTSNGMESIKDLFESQQELSVFVDNRIKNRRIGNNQYGEIIPNDLWFDRHASGTSMKPAIPVFDTGKQECYKITLSNGLELKVSSGHEMWVDDDMNGKKVIAKDILIGDKIPLISGECGYGSDHFPEISELMGNLMGDGSLGKSAAWNFFGNDIPYGKKLLEIAHSLLESKSGISRELKVKPANGKYNVESASFSSTSLASLLKDNFQLSKKPRRVPKRLFKATKQTITAFLRGLYAADGHSEDTVSVVLAQNDREFLQQIQLLLSNMGIRSTLLKHGESCKKTITYSDGSEYLTERKACFRLLIGGWDQVAIFAKEIGMGVPVKQERLLRFLKLQEGKVKGGAWRTARVVSVEAIGIKQTYCTNEPESNTVTANGIVTGNCRCTLVYLSQGFGFKQGKLGYVSENHDAYAKQRE